MFSTRSGAAKLAFAVVIGLIVLKIVVAVVTGSISISAQAMDSFLDLFAIAITFFAVRLATMPADEQHPFGHGKVEGMAAIVQAAIDAASDDAFDYIVLGYGICSNGTAGLTTGATALVIPRAHDCITFFLGSKQRYAEEFRKAPGTYYYTCGWIEREGGQKSEELMKAQQEGRQRSKYEEYVRKYGEDNAKYLIEMESAWMRNYNRAVFINQGLGDVEKYREFTRGIAQRRGWDFVELPGDDTLLLNLVSAMWPEGDFLVLRPGEAIEPTYDDAIVRAKRQ